MSPGLCGGAHWSGDEGIAEALGAACVRRVTGCPVLGRADHPRGVGRPTVSTLDRIDFRVVAGGIRCHLGWARLIRGTLRLWRSIWSRVTSPSSGLTRWSTPPITRCSVAGASTAPSTWAGGPEILAECRVLRKIRYRSAHRGVGGHDRRAAAGPLGDPHRRADVRQDQGQVGPVAVLLHHQPDRRRRIGRRDRGVPVVSSGVYGWPKDDAIR